MSSSVPVPCTSCSALIVFAETATGERMPVDAAPCDAGTMTLHRRHGEELPLCRNVAERFRFGRKDLYISHFATCTDPDAHRNRARPKPVPPGMWLIANSPADLPYPCMCQRKGWGCKHGAQANRCLCAARTDIDHLPLACCARRAAAKSKEKSCQSTGLSPSASSALR